MARFAERTQVPASKSRIDIEKVLTKYGATGFLFGQTEEKAIVGFQMRDRHIRFTLPLAGLKDQEIRQRWRALLLTIKSKLESVECEIEEFEEAFLAHIVLADGQTVGKWMQPQIETTYQSGKMPPLLPAPGSHGS